MTVKIYIVEQDQNIAELISSSFRSEGYETDVYTNVGSTFKQCLQELPDILVLDFALPSKGAINVLEMMRKIEAGRKVPIILLGNVESGKVSLKELLKQNYGVAEFIEKPFRISTLLNAVKTVREERSGQRNTAAAPSPEVTQNLAQASPEPIRTDDSQQSPEEPGASHDAGNFEDSFIDLIEPGQVNGISPLARRAKIDLPHIPTAAEIANLPPPDLRSAESGKQHVIIVDDEIMILKVIKKFLEEEGYLVTATHKSTEAYKLVIVHRPALLISDIMMPQLDGYALCKLIKSKKELASVKIMLLTAKNLKQDKGDGFKSGADFFMQKPINRLKLVSVVNSLLAPD